MTSRRHLVTTLLFLGATAFASAQSASDWTGWYLGGNAGYAFGKSNVTTSTVFSSTGYFASGNVPYLNADGSGSVKPKGFTGGLAFGYNAQSGTTVFGFDMDANAFGVKGDRSVTAVYHNNAPTTYTINETTKGGYLVTARGRLGGAIGRNLWYGTAGLALASIKIEDRFSDTFASAAESLSKSKTKAGWTVGVGYEHDMQNHWSFKAEALYVDFGKVSGESSNLTDMESSAPPVALTTSVSYPSSTFTHTADLKAEVIRFGFNYRF